MDDRKSFVIVWPPELNLPQPLSVTWDLDPLGTTVSLDLPPMSTRRANKAAEFLAPGIFPLKPFRIQCWFPHLKRGIEADVIPIMVRVDWCVRRSSSLSVTLRAQGPVKNLSSQRKF